MTYFSDAKLLITMIFRYLQMQIFVNEAITLFNTRLLILQSCYTFDYFCLSTLILSFLDETTFNPILSSHPLSKQIAIYNFARYI